MKTQTKKSRGERTDEGGPAKVMPWIEGPRDEKGRMRRRTMKKKGRNKQLQQKPTTKIKRTAAQMTRRRRWKGE
jgi:hypothetical protein